MARIIAAAQGKNPEEVEETLTDEDVLAYLCPITSNEPAKFNLGPSRASTILWDDSENQSTKTD